MFAGRWALALRAPKINPIQNTISRQRRWGATGATTRAAPVRRRISLRPYIYATVFIALGAVGGNLARFVASPPEPTKPFTPEDEKILARITRDIDALDVVQKMRASSSGYNVADGQRWREVLVDSLADVEKDISNTADPTITRTLVKKSCAGSRGLGVQRIFWNPTTKELAAVIWLGPALVGWPGLAHGGAIAMLFEEGFLRAVAGPDKPLDSVSMPSSLALTYAAPTFANKFYILRASLSSPQSPEPSSVPLKERAAPSSWFNWLSPRKDLTKLPQSSPQISTIEVNGTLESLQGKVCVRAKSTWPATVIS